MLLVIYSLQCILVEYIKTKKHRPKTFIQVNSFELILLWQEISSLLSHQNCINKSLINTFRKENNNVTSANKDKTTPQQEVYWR